MNISQLPREQITGDTHATLSLYELVGLNVNPFGKLSYEEYEAKLDGMTLADLQDEAIRVSVVARDSRDRLIRDILTQYNETAGRIAANRIQNKEASAQYDAQANAHLTKKQQKQVADILSMGR